MSVQSTPSRRFDLDWLRIIAFGLLILYHVGMFYVTWDFHVKSHRASALIEPLMLMVNPWRLELLFFISGVAARAMLDKSTPLAFARSRFNRLFWPLIFGTLVIVPPQSYFEIVSDIHFSGGYADFYGKYLTHYKGWCDHNGCLSVPTWNHLWYVAYLLVYCLLLALVWPILHKLPLHGLKGCPVWVFVGIAIVALWVARLTLQVRFPETHALVGDWYLHANSLGFFLAGVAAARSDRLFAFAAKARWVCLAVALVAYGVLMAEWSGGLNALLTKTSGHILWTGLQSVQCLCALTALIGFAHQHLAGADVPWRRILTEAIFPFYIVHQTIIVVVAYTLDRMNLPVALEATLLILSTVAGCVLTYVIVRKIGPLRLVFGLKPSVR